MAGGAWDRVLRFLGFGPEEEFDEDEWAEEAAPGRSSGDQDPGYRRSRRRRAAVEALEPGNGPAPSNVVPLAPGASPRQPMKVLLVEPRSFDDVQSIVDQLKARRPIILNLEGLEREVAHRILNFLHGAIYALGGETQKVAAGIFFFAPPGVDVANFGSGLGTAASGGAYDPTSLEELLAGAARFTPPGAQNAGERGWDAPGPSSGHLPRGGRYDFDWRR